MTSIEKIKKIVLIAFGFGLATYLIMSGFAILDKEAEVQGEHNESVTTD